MKSTKLTFSYVYIYEWNEYKKKERILCVLVNRHFTAYKFCQYCTYDKTENIRIASFYISKTGNAPKYKTHKCRKVSRGSNDVPYLLKKIFHSRPQILILYFCALSTIRWFRWFLDRFDSTTAMENVGSMCEWHYNTRTIFSLSHIYWVISLFLVVVVASIPARYWQYFLLIHIDKWVLLSCKWLTEKMKKIWFSR